MAKEKARDELISNTNEEEKTVIPLDEELVNIPSSLVITIQ